MVGDSLAPMVVRSRPLPERFALAFRLREIVATIPDDASKMSPIVTQRHLTAENAKSAEKKTRTK
jgi:hypothetical protein